MQIKTSVGVTVAKLIVALVLRPYKFGLSALLTLLKPGFHYPS